MNELKYIQNRQHWCWAVACKIVGEQYKKLHNEYDFHIMSEEYQGCGSVNAYECENGVITNNLEGINWKLQRGDSIKVDAWQRAIVMNANTARYIGFEGDVDGDDEAKIRGIKYYLTGDIYSNKVKIETIGFYDDVTSLFDNYRSRIKASSQRQEYAIGNAVLQERDKYHSFVVLYIEGERVMLYDPANGEILYHSVQEVFYNGFRSQSGVGIIKWMQIIA